MDTSPTTPPDLSNLETDVVLRNGSTVHIRLASPADLRLLEDYFIGLSDGSRRLRFWPPSVDITEQSKRAVEVDNVNHMTLLAVGGVGTERMLGGAQFYREGTSHRAEVSMSVTDW